MNRTFKLRAWDAENNEMIDGDSLAFEEYAPLCDLVVDSDEMTYMEFTTLLDRNHKEVYEGDLLRFPAKNDWEKTNFVIYEVFFHDNNACDTHIGWQMNRLHYIGNICGTSLIPEFKPENVSKMEVIGNIFENKDLL